MAILIVRDPRPRTFILGLAASTLIWFCFLTQMHERYAYGALIFLLLLIPERRIQWLCLAFGVVFTLNLLVGRPAGADLPRLAAVPGVHSIDRRGGDDRRSPALVIIWMTDRPRTERATPRTIGSRSPTEPPSV